MIGFFDAMWQGFLWAFTFGTNDVRVPLLVLGGLFLVGIGIGFNRQRKVISGKSEGRSD